MGKIWFSSKDHERNVIFVNRSWEKCDFCQKIAREPWFLSKDHEREAWFLSKDRKRSVIFMKRSQEKHDFYRKIEEKTCFHQKIEKTWFLSKGQRKNMIFIKRSKEKAIFTRKRELTPNCPQIVPKSPLSAVMFQKIAVNLRYLFLKNNSESSLVLYYPSQSLCKNVQNWYANDIFNL